MAARTLVVLVVAWLVSLAAVGVWAQARQSQDSVISGNDIGFQVERVDEVGKPIGTLVVRVNGHWVEATFAVGPPKLAAR